MSTSDRRGLLLAMMEPPVAMEEEFQDWYDTEHFPERAGLKEFLTARRFVCVEGWPRYLTLYDLTDVSALHTPDYAKIAGERYSPWTYRIVPRLWGQYRAEGVQIHPGQALLGDHGNTARLLLCRFRQVQGDVAGTIQDGLRTLFEARPDTAQVRLFEAAQTDGTDYLGLVELRGAASAAMVEAGAFGAAAGYLDMVNVYVAYARRVTGGLPKAT
jgi:hypothetical protein